MLYDHNNDGDDHDNEDNDVDGTDVYNRHFTYKKHDRITSFHLSS